MAINGRKMVISEGFSSRINLQLAQISIFYQINWVFFCANYSREENIQGWKLFAEIRYVGMFWVS